jgi:membrane protein implicated in regulation of membrane protease activity
MPWWGWIIFGAFLLGSELVVVDAAFYLVFIGIAAMLTGIVDLAGLQLEFWEQWMLFAGLALLSMVMFRKKLYQQIRGGEPGFDASPTGEILKLEENLQPGDSCRMELRGTNWTILNSSGVTFEKGSNVRVAGVEGLTLKIGPLDNSQ